MCLPQLLYIKDSTSLIGEKKRQEDFEEKTLNIPTYPWLGNRFLYKNNFLKSQYKSGNASESLFFL